MECDLGEHRVHILPPTSIHPAGMVSFCPCANMLNILGSTLLCCAVYATGVLSITVRL